jgi:hypothetical protein
MTGKNAGEWAVDDIERVIMRSCMTSDVLGHLAMALTGIKVSRPTPSTCASFRPTSSHSPLSTCPV